MKERQLKTVLRGNDDLSVRPHPRILGIRRCGPSGVIGRGEPLDLLGEVPPSGAANLEPPDQPWPGRRMRETKSCTSLVRPAPLHAAAEIPTLFATRSEAGLHSDL